MKYPANVRQRLHGDATDEEIRAGWVDGPPRALEPVRLRAHDPTWSQRFSEEAQRIRAALGSLVLGLEHVGSTAVPGLVAKPIVDVDLLVADSEHEYAYLHPLTAIGYRLVLREPWWWGHRMLVSNDDVVNLHVFPFNAGEPVRHVLFRDWLRCHPEDRQRYAEAKEALAHSTSNNPEAYNLAKNAVIDNIYERIWAADDANGSATEGH